ncbi:maltokinase N-terminal cap-like domain-containing protein [Streptomyces sp. OZ13]|uniref:maltokinase N-terminal cap-like domain-containing protein n=1 Tax=Streptomyces sp. OZ13 TaxID=3452210 RepID=UPI003F8B4113
MAVIHRTTMTPGKLELLAAWLPSRPWYEGTASRPELSKAGGFRLDDPKGEVGIEFMVVTDTSGDRPRSYHVPLSYRGAPLEGADAAALIGTSEHGVLGTRWVYDGTHDPVLVEQLLALVEGNAEPQAQSVSDTPDPSVTAHLAGAPLPPTVTPAPVTDDEHGTHLAVSPGLVLHVTRRLDPAAPMPDARAHVTASWHTPDGTENRSRFAVLGDATP